MQQLQKINGQKWIDVIEDFLKSIPPDVFDGPLEAKKKQVEQTLEQMKKFFSAQEGTQQCSGDHPPQQEALICMGFFPPRTYHMPCSGDHPPQQNSPGN